MSIVSHDKTVWKQEVSLACPDQTRMGGYGLYKKTLAVWEIILVNLFY